MSPPSPDRTRLRAALAAGLGGLAGAALAAALGLATLAALPVVAVLAGLAAFADRRPGSPLPLPLPAPPAPVLDAEEAPALIEAAPPAEDREAPAVLLPPAPPPSLLPPSPPPPAPDGAAAAEQARWRSLRHDLRGILSPALLMADRLLMSSEDKLARRTAETVIEAVERAEKRLLSDPPDGG